MEILRANEACQDEMRKALDRQMLFANRIIPKLKPGSGTGPAVEAVVRRVVLPRRERQPHQGVHEPLAGKQPSASDATRSGARTGLSRGGTFTNLSLNCYVRISSPRSTSSSTVLPVRDPLGGPSGSSGRPLSLCLVRGHCSIDRYDIQ